MGAPRLFFALFSIMAGFAIAGAIMGPLLIDTSIGVFVPPSEVRDYVPPSSGLAGVFGDYIWGLSVTLKWLGQTPQILATIISSLGVPEPLVSILMTVASISLGAYIIYLVSGRVISALA